MKSLLFSTIMLLISSIVSACFALTGIVKDPSGLPLSNVTIKYNDKNFTTDTLGNIAEGSSPVKKFVKVNDSKDLFLSRNTMDINLTNYEKPVQVKITSLQGKQISNKKINFHTNGKQSISLNDLSSNNLAEGMYFVNVIFNDENHLLSLNTVRNSASIRGTGMNKKSAFTGANKYSNTATFEKAGYLLKIVVVGSDENAETVKWRIAETSPETIDAPFFVNNFFFPVWAWENDQPFLLRVQISIQKQQKYALEVLIKVTINILGNLQLI